MDGSFPVILSGLPAGELEQALVPLPRFRAAQIAKWIASGAETFDEMSNLPVSLREELIRRFLPRPTTVVDIFASGDGTEKITLRFDDSVRVESVLLADGFGRRNTRFTACLSTQAGCPAGCVFCKTGKAFIRNLTSAEIVEQLLILRKKAAAVLPADSAAHPVSNIVIMGMGEPLLNLMELRRALAVITGKNGFGYSPRRITVSTCGIVAGIDAIAKDMVQGAPRVQLALSLTTADEKLRRRLMPITANQPLQKVKDALRRFQAAGGGRVTLEAVLLGGINTRAEDAAAIASFAEGIDAVVNLIPWNPVDGLTFEGKPLKEPSPAETASCIRRLEALGLTVTRRFRRGRGIMGACGQLGPNGTP